jgi:hypothetical protein
VNLVNSEYSSTGGGIDLTALITVSAIATLFKEL